MRRALMLVTMLLFATLCLESEPNQTPSGKDGGAKNQSTTPSLQVKGTFRPRVSMQDALKIAEDYIDKQHIDIRPFWLYRAIYFLSGDEKTPDKDKLRGWDFLWVDEAGTSGGDVEIFVGMDGTANRMPSM
jgi:hypothetical protein